MKIEPKRSRGRPREFDPAVALDRAIDVFWREGYEGADYRKLSAAMKLTKPSIYAAYGNKRALFSAALKRYAEGLASKPFAAAARAPTIQLGAANFFEGLVDLMGGDTHPRGCLMITVAAQCAEVMPEVRQFLADGFAWSDAGFREILREAVNGGQLPANFPVADRASLWTDLSQSMALRARAGASRDDLLALARRATATLLAPGPA